MRESPDSKELGSYYTPAAVVRTLVSWATNGGSPGAVLDPSCGDGRFLAGLDNAVGVDVDPEAAGYASRHIGAHIITADFFAWASETDRRFAATVGNPPFIRYQRFAGEPRLRALRYCAAQGVKLSGLSSSWAPFVVAASSLLMKGGRLAFVVPAEIGHAVYAKPVVRYLLSSFERVEIVAVREKAG
jgi:adenine-specific DNA methylase